MCPDLLAAATSWPAGHCRVPLQVRFESPPAAMASKPFQNDEQQQVTEFHKGHKYVVESLSLTSAPYGDKFKIYFRYTTQAAAKGTCTLLVEAMIEFLPSMSGLLKPVVSKAVEGGSPGGGPWQGGPGRGEGCGGGGPGGVGGVVPRTESCMSAGLVLVNDGGCEG